MNKLNKQLDNQTIQELRELNEAIQIIRPLIEVYNESKVLRANHMQKTAIDLVGRSLGMPKMNYSCSSCVGNTLKKIIASGHQPIEIKTETIESKSTPVKGKQIKGTKDGLKALSKKQLLTMAIQYGYEKKSAKTKDILIDYILENKPTK